jgi:hypothetical protein
MSGHTHRLISMKRWARAVAAAALLPALAACRGSDSPTTPSSPPVVDLDRTNTPLEWSDERYFLEISGGDLSGDPNLPPCSPFLWPPGGKFVNTFVWFHWEGSELVGRPRPPSRATVEVRMRRVSSSVLGVAITGTVTGSVPDEYDRVWGLRDSVFNVDGPVTMEGTVPPRAALDQRGPVLGGLLRGPSSFNDSHTLTSFCTNVRYILQPAPPGGIHDDPTLPPLAGLRAVASDGASARTNGALPPSPPAAGNRGPTIQP